MWPPNGIAPCQTVVVLLALCFGATFSRAAAVVDVTPAAPTNVGRAVGGGAPFALQIISLPTYKPSLPHRSHQKDSVPSESNGQANRIAVASPIASSEIDLGMVEYAANSNDDVFDASWYLVH